VSTTQGERSAPWRQTPRHAAAVTQQNKWRTSTSEEPWLALPKNRGWLFVLRRPKKCQGWFLLLFCLFDVLNSPCHETSKNAIKKSRKTRHFWGTMPFFFFCFRGGGMDLVLVKNQKCFVCVCRHPKKQTADLGLVVGSSFFGDRKKGKKVPGLIFCVFACLLF
jgi:hypothetical protein